MRIKIYRVSLRRIFREKDSLFFFLDRIQCEQLIKTLFVRKFIFLLTVLFVTIVSTQHVNAQISATAETTAKIVSGLQITKEADLNFGSMFSPRNGGGTVTVDVNNQRTSNGVQLATVTEKPLRLHNLKSPASQTLPLPLRSRILSALPIQMEADHQCWWIILRTITSHRLLHLMEVAI